MPVNPLSHNHFLNGFAEELAAVKLAAPKSHLTPGSSNVAGFRYDAGKKQLFVTYKGGGTYKYNGVPSAVFKKLRSNKSVGKTINRSVKAPGFEYEKVAKQKSYKCRYCKEPATKGVIWAEGRAIVPCCEKHLGKGKSSVNHSDIDLIRDLTKTSSPKNPTAQEKFYTNNYKSGSKANKTGSTAQEKTYAVRGRSAKGKMTPSQRYYKKKRRLERMAKKAGAVKKQVTWNGITMKLEYLKGDERSGVNGATGKSWSRIMSDNYGYMPGTYGKGDDGEALDVYFNSDAKPELSKTIYRILQKKKTGEHDESKFMVGYVSASDAKKAFLRNMPSWAFGSMSSLSMGKFRNVVGQPAKKVPS